MSFAEQVRQRLVERGATALALEVAARDAEAYQQNGLTVSETAQLCIDIAEIDSALPASYLTSN